MAIARRTDKTAGPTSVSPKRDALRQATAQNGEIAEALGASHPQHRSLIEALGVAAYTTDATGRITVYNEAAAALWGRRPEPGNDQWCGSWRLYRPDGTPMPHDECPMAVTLKENRPVRDVEILVERPDGARSFVLPFPAPLRDASGALIGAVNVLIDITERKRAVAEADAQRELVNAITDNMSVGLLLIDTDGRIQFMNPAAEKITGYQFEDAQGKAKHELLHYRHPDGRPFPRSECPIETANDRSQRIIGQEDVFVRPDGTSYNVLCNVAPIVREGAIAGAILDLRDATEEKKTEEAIRQSMAFKDQFLGLVSHELRTPIATIVGNALLLLRRGEALAADDKQQSLLDLADESKKLQRIIENLLLLARVDVGEQLDAEPLLLRPLIAQAVDSFQRREPQRSISVMPEGEVPIALGQAESLLLVLDNLISNAHKYSPPDAPIEIRIRANGSEDVEVCVRDYGMGLDQDETEAVFTPFYRSAKAKTHAKGIGLGLAVCKRVIEAQGGSIRAWARPEGGCDFVFSLQQVRES